MNGWRSIGWALMLLVPFAFGAEVEVPQPLEAWIGWALHGVEGIRCPHRFDADQPRLCTWPGPLILKADESGVGFSQDWEVYERSFVPLPGFSRQWPKAVQVDGQPAAVVSRGERPHLWLGPGRHRVKGQIAWQTLPATLQVPPQTGRVELSLQGRPEPFPQLEVGGLLWLRKQPPALSGKEPQIKLRVFRLIEDEVPQRLTTRILLDVAGPMREVVLPRVGMAGFTEFALTSPLPARLEPDGRLRLQLRPGSFQVEVGARSEGARDRLELDRRPPPWPEQEIWSFAAHPELRIVREQGGRRIDPSLAEAPEAWQRHPAYVMAAGDALELKLIQRGSPAEIQDALSLQRNLWLDFAGRGITFQDRIRGTLVSGSRLTASEIRPGEARLDGVPALITALEDDPRPGVEVRRGRLEAEVTGRYEGTLSALPANGWAHRFQAAEAYLNLPPGWRVLAVSGTDSAAGTWLERWTLLDLFLVLIVALAVSRLRGWPWGAMALAGVALSWHEPGAPHYLWLNLVAAVALARWLPAGRVGRWARIYHAASISTLVLVAFPFFVYEMRAALYPQLEIPQALPSPVPVAMEMREEALAVPEAQTPEAKLIQPPPSPPEALLGPIQTGPAVPDWRWHSVVLRWSGPIEPGQRVRVWALGPVPTRLLRVLDLVLVASLLWRLAGWPGLRGNSPAGLAGLLVLDLLSNHDVRAQGFPDPALLEALKARLTEPARCLPRCAEIAQVQLAADPGTLRLNLEIQAAIETAVPLPEQAGVWTPAEVLVDGKRHDLLLRGGEGNLWLGLKAGVHRVLLTGPLPARDRIVLHFPLPPRRLTFEVNGWQVFGVAGEDSPPGEVELVRERPIDALSPLPLPGFARLERSFLLGLEWYVDYRLERISAPDEALVLKIPLMQGESLITRDLAVQAGKVEVRLPPGQQSLTWRTHLDPRSRLVLTATPSLSAGQPAWIEVWRLEASPLWHVRAEGVPAVHLFDPGGDFLPQWRPWPGERLTLTVTRPQAVTGPTLTLDRAALTLRPGRESQALELELQLHSSRGEIHTLTLPPAIVLEEVEIDGESRPLRMEQERLNLPVDPGSHRIRVLWHHLQPAGYLLRIPQVDLGASAANLNLRVEQGNDRWVLATGGPVLGPAVLLWGLMAVLVVLAWGLSRLHLTPLKAWQWFLLLLGLTQPPLVLGALVVGWLLLLGLRERLAGALGARGYNLVQVATAATTVLALAALFLAVRQGLLGLPDMQVTGQGSTASSLNWYQDRVGPRMPQAWVLWAPLWIYRVLMLVWALWLASALIGWLRWLWQVVASQGLRRRESSVVSPSPNDSSS